MMDQRMDVREDRLTHQMKDEWCLIVGCSGILSDRQTDRGIFYTQVIQNCMYTIFFYTCNEC